MPVPGRIKTTCPYCGVGCGILAEPAADGSVEIQGDPDHPANYGRLCSKGSALGETVDLKGRLLYPEVNGRRSEWETALDLIAARFSSTIAKHGPESVAFYVSGQILTEDYYVANKLMKGFIGSANIDTNSRLCMASAVAGHKRAFGSDTVPGVYSDLELADVVVLAGSNLAWCHPVLYQRIAAAKSARPDMQVILIDPRRTMTADIADMHLPIAADGDTALFAGLLNYLFEKGCIDGHFTARHTTGLNEALTAARSFTISQVASQTDLSVDTVQRFYALWTANEKVVTVYSQGVNQSAFGTDKVNAVINCHLATGRMGRPGMGPFSITGQPNAMGGREVGGLANMLAAHMELDNPQHRDRVQGFWRSPTIARKPGLKAVELFDAVADGGVKALWIMATNPVDTLPDADKVESAIKSCPFVVVSDIMASTDTVRHADVRLPSLAWGEKDGTVTNSERRISRQRVFLPPPGEARADWWQMAEVARRMGHRQGFAYPNAAAIFREHAALTGLENDDERSLDISGMAGMSDTAYDIMAPFQWPQRDVDVAVGAESRFFAKGGFFTSDRKARFVAVQPHARIVVNSRQPYILNTGRARDHWHTMTRTGKSRRLSAHAAEPYAEIHPQDAQALMLDDADLVRLSNRYGRIVVRVQISDRQKPGSVFVPMHWTDQVASRARVDTLVAPVVDPVSGQPASKNTAVDLRKFNPAFFGFAVTAHRQDLSWLDYWAVARIGGGWQAELAGMALNADSGAFANRIFGLRLDSPLLSYNDRKTGTYRFAAFDGPRLLGVLYLSPQPVAVSRSWAVEQMTSHHALLADRWRVVAGRPGADTRDKGGIVCACLSVGANEIADAVRAGCRSAAAVGEVTRAGTNCGSCRAEIRGLIDEHQILAAE